MKKTFLIARPFTFAIYLFTTPVFGQTSDVTLIEVDSNTSVSEPFQLLEQNYSNFKPGSIIYSCWMADVVDSCNYSFFDNSIVYKGYNTGYGPLGEGVEIKESVRIEVSKKKGIRHIHLNTRERESFDVFYEAELRNEDNYYDHLCILMHPRKKGRIQSITAYKDSSIVGQRFFFSKQGYLDQVDDYKLGELIRSTFFYWRWDTDGHSLDPIFTYVYMNFNKDINLCECDVDGFEGLIEDFTLTINKESPLGGKERKVEATVEWTQGKGEAKLFDFDGNLYATGDFDVNGKRHGIWTFYTKTGEVKNVKNYMNGKKIR